MKYGNFKNYSAVILILFIVFLGCSVENKKTHEVGSLTPKYGGTLHFLQESPHTLDPLHLDDIYESSIINQLFEGLLALDNNLNIVPGLAQTWDISPDKLTYTFYLRKGVKFHNGREVIADDIVHSIKRIMNSNAINVSSWKQLLKHIKGLDKDYFSKNDNIEGLQIVDKYTLKIILAQPLVPLLYLLAAEIVFIVPKEEVEKKGEIEFGKNPVGCGPFRFASWEKDKKIILIANKDYYKGRPYLDTLIFKIENYTFEKSISQFKNREIDVTYIPSRLYDEFNNSEYKLIARPEISLMGLGFNINKYPFNILKVRQAIYYATDNESYISKNMHSNLPAQSILPQPMVKYVGAFIKKKFVLEKAKILLNEAGFKDGRGLDTLELWSLEGEITAKIVDNLTTLGLKVKTRNAEWDTYINMLDKKKMGMFMFSVVGDSPDPSMFYSSLLNSTGSNNYFNFQNKQVDSLLENMHGQNSLNSLKQICQNIENIAADSVPFVPILYYVNNVSMQSHVMDLNINPFGLAASKLSKVWLNK